jgi:hypothetical protein
MWFANFLKWSTATILLGLTFADLYDDKLSYARSIMLYTATITVWLWVSGLIS